MEVVNVTFDSLRFGGFNLSDAHHSTDYDAETDDKLCFMDAKAIYNDNPATGFALAHGCVSRLLGRMLAAPPIVVAEVLRELLEKRPPPGSPYDDNDPNQHDLTTQLVRVRVHLLEESDRFKKLLDKLRQTRGMCDGAELATATKRRAYDCLVQEGKDLRGKERAAKEEARSARLAADAAGKGNLDRIRRIERDLLKEHERTKRLRAKLASDRASADDLEAQSDALHVRVEAAERDSAVMLLREASAGETLRAYYVADVERVAVEKRREDAELSLGRTIERCDNAEVLLEVARVRERDAQTKLDEVLLRGEGLRYRLMDAMRDVSMLKERVFHAESACCAGF